MNSKPELCAADNYLQNDSNKPGFVINYKINLNDKLENSLQNILEAYKFIHQKNVDGTYEYVGWVNLHKITIGHFLCGNEIIVKIRKNIDTYLQREKNTYKKFNSADTKISSQENNENQVCEFDLGHISLLDWCIECDANTGCIEKEGKDVDPICMTVNTKKINDFFGENGKFTESVKENIKEYFADEKEMSEFVKKFAEIFSDFMKLFLGELNNESIDFNDRILSQEQNKKNEDDDESDDKDDDKDDDESDDKDNIDIRSTDTNNPKILSTNAESDLYYNDISFNLYKLQKKGQNNEQVKTYPEDDSYVPDKQTENQDNEHISNNIYDNKNQDYEYVVASNETNPTQNNDDFYNPDMSLHYKYSLIQ